jgi:hypothetical protein
MLNISQFRELIVKSTLNDLVMYSANAEELLIFTCAVESEGGTYLHQVKGPALGIFQMEPMTYTDIWQNYIKSHGPLSLRLFSNFDVTGMPTPDRMIYDLRFAAAMARIFYARVNEPLPDCTNENAIWDYYKRYYNTPKGAALKQPSMEKYHAFLRG